MATRWIRQKNGSSCGPVALLNLLKWLGRDVSYDKDFSYWKERCCCDRHGTPLDAFLNALHSIDGIGVQPRIRPSVEVIDSALQRGRIAVMKSAFNFDGEVEGHFFLVTERTNKSFYCVNVYCGHRWLTKDRFEAWWLQHHPWYCDGCGVAPYCWLISKKNTMSGIHAA